MTEHSHLRSGIVAAIATCAVGAAIGTFLGTAVVVAAVATAGVVLLTFLRLAATHGWLTRQLLVRSTDTEVAGTRLRLGNMGGSVFVAGLARPSIFCDNRLLDDLDDDEITAVTLHERAHQHARDPVRNLAVATLAPLLIRIRCGRGWLERRAAAREIAADRYAMTHGAQRRAIASALLKVSPTGAVHTSPFAPAAELRLRALLGDDTDRRRPPSGGAITVGVLVGVGVCLVVLHPAVSLADAITACCPS